ncbi:hypothetical protein BDU57DRAFT_542086 [Ampelomyces quisqualis]|uniref:F-box domain-containing protein n=1 Tax=Ampelomyces quisqualis TaxID=50730 RepID=A0A6A5QA01_AMPQU|nr:hypothetical protein BDU57DRAFT_542086 [Ampelomyces quisqualis]
MANLDSLNDDILYLILDHLSSERLTFLRCLRAVSKQLRGFADAILYSTIVLEESNVFQEQASFRSIERLLDPADNLRRHVRLVKVNSYKGNEESFCMNTHLLVACLRSIQKLYTFSWDTKVPLPDSILDAVHQHHPGAQLEVSLDNLTHRVVSSAQLHRLSMVVPCSDVFKPGQLMAFHQLRDVLVKSPQLRALSLDIHLDVSVREAAKEHIGEQYRSYGRFEEPVCNESWNHPSGGSDFCDDTGDIQIPIQPGDRWASLEELNINARTYQFDTEHCLRLQQCLDWTKLKRLTLGPSNPVAFFETFTGKVPRLEHLDLAYHMLPSDRYPHYVQARDFEHCLRFVSSLSKLKTLVVRCDSTDFGNTFWSHVAVVHGGRLESLSLRARHNQFDGPMCKCKLYEFLTFFTRLKNLDLALAAQPYLSCNKCSKPWQSVNIDYVKAIPNLSTLQDVHISIQIHPNNDRDFLQCIIDHALCAIRHLWTAFTANHCSNNLRSFRIHFWRWENPALHVGKDVFAHDTCFRSNVLIDSEMRGSYLVVRARDYRRSITTKYLGLHIMEPEGDGEGPRLVFMEAHREQRNRICE